MPRVTPEQLKPYTFQGLIVDWNDSNKNASADCPFCGKAGKFGIEIETSKYKCFTCGKVGNALTFLRSLIEKSEDSTNNYEELSASIGLLTPDPLIHWRVARSYLSRLWLIPGYNAQGKVIQLYKRALIKNKYRFLATPNHSHGFLGDYRSSSDTVYICEGLSDGAMLWEVLNRSRWEGDKLVYTADATHNALTQGTSVIAVPGANIFIESWIPLFKNKHVNLIYDNDHPKNGYSAALSGLQRAASLLNEEAAEVHYLKWGEDSQFNTDLKDGYDLKDYLSQGKTIQERVALLNDLQPKFQQAPKSWIKTSPKLRSNLKPAKCELWTDLVDHWSKPGALRFRKELQDVMTVLLAVILSTDQSGEQLFLQLIGDPGSAKTKMCDALLTSEHCYLIEHLTGFHSGWRGDKDGDYSLLARANRKCWITPEGDVIMSNPKFTEIMSQQRRIFDGSSSASYKNIKQDKRYVNLRTPWIIAGTPDLIDMDQARLGDRFLRIYINKPASKERREILRRVGLNALDSVRQVSSELPESHMHPDMANAYKRTGGYINYLKANSDKLQTVHCSERRLDQCVDLAEIVAFMRAAPSNKINKQQNFTVELPTRLHHQFVRLACCVAVVLNENEVTDNVMRIVRKVALDTSKGTTMTVAEFLFPSGAEGVSASAMAVYNGAGTWGQRSYLEFLTKIGVVVRKIDSRKRIRYVLSSKISRLYKSIVLGEQYAEDSEQ